MTLITKLRTLAAGEDGLVSWATLIAVLFFTLLGALVFNVGNTVTKKLETQNAADSVAYAGALWQARGLNAVTAANHMMGELTALYVLHHAVGGEYLDVEEDYSRKNNSGPIRGVNERLKLAWHFPIRLDHYVRVTGLKPLEEHFKTVSEQPFADEESTVYEAKLRLKELMTAAYLLHRAGQAVYDLGEVYPWLKPVGIAMMAAALAAEYIIYKEYMVLNAFERLAFGIKNVKRRVIPAVLNALWAYQHSVVRTTPEVAAGAAEAVGSLNRRKGTLAYHEMPVEHETTESVKRSQLMRASYPWVHYWRKPIVDFLDNPVVGAPLSRAPRYYMKWTNEYSFRIVRWFTEEEGRHLAWAPKRFRGQTEEGWGFRLHVLKDLNVPQIDKGQEAWTRQEGSIRADDLFCELGFAQMEEAPTVAARPFFRQENPDGVICYAQAMAYNANPQEPGTGGNRFQPRVGWDTLNWDPRCKAVEYPSDSRHPPRPGIKLNWQAKLVPVTGRKIDVAGGGVSTGRESRILNTH